MAKALSPSYEAPWVTFDPIAERFMCARCRAIAPIAGRSAEGLVLVGMTFLRTHAACMAPSEAGSDRSDLFEGSDARSPTS